MLLGFLTPRVSVERCGASTSKRQYFVPFKALQTKTRPHARQLLCTSRAPPPIVSPTDCTPFCHIRCGPGPGAWGEEQTYPPHAASPSDDSFSSVSKRLRRLSERSEEALSKLPNKGQPSIGRDGMLREYRGVDTSDLPDPGHRHSSGLWALYPGFQVAFGGGQRLCISRGSHYDVQPLPRVSPTRQLFLFGLLLYLRG